MIQRGEVERKLQVENGTLLERLHKLEGHSSRKEETGQGEEGSVKISIFAGPQGVDNEWYGFEATIQYIFKFHVSN
jgi:hypothetical protein